MTPDLRDVTITEKTATSTRTEVFRMDIANPATYIDDGLQVGYFDINGGRHVFIKDAIVSAQFMPVEEK